MPSSRSTERPGRPRERTKGQTKRVRILLRIRTLVSAKERTRTFTTLRPPAPEAGASAIPPPSRFAIPYREPKFPRQERRPTKFRAIPSETPERGAVHSKTTGTLQGKAGWTAGLPEWDLLAPRQGCPGFYLKKESSDPGGISQWRHRVETVCRLSAQKAHGFVALSTRAFYLGGQLIQGRRRL